MNHRVKNMLLYYVDAHKKKSTEPYLHIHDLFINLRIRIPQLEKNLSETEKELVAYTGHYFNSYIEFEKIGYKAIFFLSDKVLLLDKHGKPVVFLYNQFYHEELGEGEYSDRKYYISTPLKNYKDKLMFTVRYYALPVHEYSRKRTGSTAAEIYDIWHKRLASIYWFIDETVSTEEMIKWEEELYEYTKKNRVYNFLDLYKNSKYTDLELFADKNPHREKFTYQ